MNPATFEWDDENIEHIALHGVDIVEAEAVLDNRPLVLRTQDDKYLGYGQSDEGRYLLIVFSRKPARLRVISARDLTDGEKKRLKRRRK
jgi:uncharacterized DUF497 family protein